MEEISYIENSSEFHIDKLLDHQIEKTDFSLTEKDNFNQGLKEKLKQAMSRENILKFGIMTGEIPIPIESTSGEVVISTINRSQIDKRIKTLPEKQRSKIGFIHISTVQIILKSTFMKGIDTPIDLILEDSRIINPDLALIAKGNCNLKYGKVKFDVNLQISLSLKDKDLDRSITFGYRLLNKNFMKEGNHPFTICYRINYAISNSHHSVEFKGKDRICIEELFEDLIKLESPILQNKEERSSFLPSRSSRNLEIGTSMRKQIDYRPPVILPPKRNFESSEDQNKEIEKLQVSIKNLATQVSSIDQKL